MKRSEQELIAKRIIDFYKNRANRNTSHTVRHFLAEGLLRNTIGGVIRRFNKTGRDRYLKIGGKARTVTTPEVTKKVSKLLINKRTSVRECALIAKISTKSVQNVKKWEGIKTYKCQTTPSYDNDQELRAEKNSRNISKLATKKVIVMDDETYVPLDPKNIKLQKNFNCKDKKTVPNNVRFRGKPKFFKKYLVWQAIDQFGNVSKPYVKKGTMNAREYRIECLAKRLLPFLKSKHNISNVIFWPDMAAIHYQSEVQEWLTSKGIEFVKKADNTPNCPQIRPIEKFWQFCKKDYSLLPTVCDSTEDMRKKWIKISENNSRIHGNALMAGVRKKLRLVGKEGPFAPFKS